MRRSKGDDRDNTRRVRAPAQRYHRRQPARRRGLYRVTGTMRILAQFRRAGDGLGRRRRWYSAGLSWARVWREILAWFLQLLRRALREFQKALRRLMEALAAAWRDDRTRGRGRRYVTLLDYGEALIVPELSHRRRRTKAGTLVAVRRPGLSARQGRDAKRCHYSATKKRQQTAGPR